MVIRDYFTLEKLDHFESDEKGNWNKISENKNPRTPLDEKIQHENSFDIVLMDLEVL